MQANNTYYKLLSAFALTTLLTLFSHFTTAIKMAALAQETASIITPDVSLMNNFNGAEPLIDRFRFIDGQSIATPTITNYLIHPQQSNSIASGTITDKGTPVANMPVVLRYYDGTTWSSYFTVTTNASGFYQFNTLPTVGSGKKFAVEWDNTTKNNTHLALWLCSSVTSTPTANIECSFDIANITLLSPTNGTTVSLPTTFTWQKRATTTDSYHFNLFDSMDNTPNWVSSELGYVDNYNLTSLPTGFDWGQKYGWTVYVSGTNGHGIAYYFSNITFDTPANTPTPTLTPTPTATPVTAIYYGTITDKGTPVANIPIVLWSYNGTSWTRYFTATTNSSGYYQFDTLPAVGSGKKFGVQWSNTTNNDTRLALWSCKDVSTLPTANIECSFDIANITLLSPTNGSTVSLPTTFTWQKRTTTLDSYELNILDSSQNLLWPTAVQKLGYVNSYIMDTLPSVLTYNQLYKWTIYVYGANGYGIALYVGNITFSNTPISTPTNTPAPIPTPTNTPIVGKILQGKLTENGIAISGEKVLLRYSPDGTNWATFATVTTDATGAYQFTTLPQMRSNAQFYIRWENSNQNLSRLAFWNCANITATTTDPTLYQCDFDLADVSLQLPENNAVVSLPATFTWSKRPNTTDSYVFRLFDSTDGDPDAVTSLLGYVNSYKLTQLPSGFEIGKKYGWTVYVTGVNGYGLAFYYVNITFSSPKTFLPLVVRQPTPTPMPTPTPTPTATLVPMTTLYIQSDNTGGISSVEIQDPNNGNALLLRCGPIGDNVVQLCGEFKSIGTYRFSATTNKCGVKSIIFHDALPGSVTRRVACN